MPSSRTQKLFDLALKAAKCSSCKHRHGALVALGSRVLSLGVNKSKTHPRATKLGNTIHAELAALVGAGEGSAGAALYSARVTRRGTPGNSKPCEHCALLIEHAGISRVVYWEDGEILEYRL